MFKSNRTFIHEISCLADMIKCFQFLSDNSDMIIKCPKCIKKISNEFVNLKLGLAQCNSCDVSFSISSNPSSIKKEIKDGEHDLIINDYGSTLHILFSWKKEVSAFELFFLGFFVIFWNIIAFVFVFALLNSNETNPIKYMPILHMFIGIVAAYLLVAQLLNKTLIIIENSKLKIKISPLPWLGNNELDTSKIEQVYVERHVPYEQNRVPQVRYRVKAVVDGYHVKVTGSLKRYENARMIEQVIESRLGVSDKAVVEEFV